MYSLRLTVRGEQGSSPVKFVELAATNDDEAIKLGKQKIAEEKPEPYQLTEVRVCRDEEVIWSGLFEGYLSLELLKSQ